MRNSLSYFELHRSRWAQVCTHGIGPMRWRKSEGWLPKCVAIEDVRIPTDTTLDFDDNLGWFALRHIYTPYELIKQAFDDHPSAKQWDRKAIAAIKECRFKDQIVPVELPSKKGAPPQFFTIDESPREDTTIEVLRSLKAAFKKDGTVTAGNAPGVNDGASAVVVMSAVKAQELGLKPMAHIVAQATSGIDPAWVMMAPVDAVRQLWKKTGWRNEDVDLYEINEAFSVAAIAVTRELGLDLNKVNVNGGAVALGHPIGASGARILTTLLYEMIRRDVHKGIAALCLGGGNAVGVAVER